MYQIKNATIIAGLLTSLFIGTQAEASSNIAVQINGQAIGFDQPPVMENNRVLVPMRTTFEVMGAEVEWVASISTVKANKGDLSIILPLNEKKATINGASKPLDVPAKSVNGRTLVPLRFISEALGCKVDWVSNQALVMITFDGEVKEQKGKEYPDGWVAPILKSAWSPDHVTNLRTLQNEVGFIGGGTRYSLPSYPGAINVSGGSSYEVKIKFYFWNDPAIKYSYRIPVVAEEVFKLYFGADANRVWNYFNNGDIPENFTANGRSVTATYSPADGGLTLTVDR
ncbi:copper amine oxidase N-terminal domain-containing protein [Schinkia azotoformans]|uniref:copper amine oxidase N-terminal domain-containing protein n=1 Tax=Schinkia azotoformans TaxID=1454 RepID=UPI002DB98455|nr:copper amine oxidase N-terminal domain-containing protein [Schinkia azotoformans]MEC1759861.1 copper amine oxidase N-terminal domain-containing protein [Schinkia azotoformans]